MRALAVAVCLGLASAALAVADSGQFVVIVHPDNPATAIDRGRLRDAYVGRITSWDHGEPVRPIDLRAKYPAHDRFVREVLKKSAAQLRRHWAQQIFSGKGVPPPEAESPAAVIAFVLEHPGAVGYIPAGTDPLHAKVIAIQ